MRLGFIWLLVVGLFILGCSGGNAVTPNHDLAEADGNFSTTGIMGAYELTIDSANLTADLVAKRSSTIGESYLVSGLGFFESMPCPDCFILNSLNSVDGNLVLNFGVDHPFPKGNTGNPPSAANRLDLNVFDVALVIVPQEATPTTYALSTADIYDGFVANASGYTCELAGLTTDAAACPFVLVIDDSAGTASTFNKLEMGTVGHNFDVAFSLAAGTDLAFDMYLTMGYGFSAAKKDRLAPKYYNPEFNKKPAWKVVVTPPDPITNPWYDNEFAVTRDVLVEVYDWQQGAVVATGDFGAAAITEVFAASEVTKVTCEIPGMTTLLPEQTVATSGTGAFDTPLVYTFSIMNEGMLAAGEYTGLVTVTDGRVPNTTAAERDYLIHTPNGIDLPSYVIPEYATYQVFTATVVVGP